MGPTVFQADCFRGLAGNLQVRRWELLEALREIGKNLRSNFPFAPLRPENAGDGQESSAFVLRQCLFRPHATSCRIVDEKSLFQNFQRKALLELHAGGVEDGTD